MTQNIPSKRLAQPLIMLAAGLVLASAGPLLAAPGGVFTLRVVDATTKEPTAARIHLKSRDGKPVRQKDATFWHDHFLIDGEAKRDDENFCHVAAWEYQGETKDPIRNVETLEWDAVHPTVRSYK